MKQAILVPIFLVGIIAAFIYSPALREEIHSLFTTNPIMWINSINFHEIDTNIYRSAQLSSKRLKKTIKQYGIKSVINLRDTKAGEELDKWNEAEKRVTYNNGVRLIHIPLNESKLPTNEKLERILEFFERKKHHPMLIHCHAGSDRTGMVAALYILEMKHGKDGKQIENPEALTEALTQLRFSYGHYVMTHPAMKKFIRTWYALRTDYTRDKALEKYNPSEEPLGFPINPFKLYKS
jgi:undecaprenyl-diphosphatase